MRRHQAGGRAPHGRDHPVPDGAGDPGDGPHRADPPGDQRAGWVQDPGALPGPVGLHRGGRPGGRRGRRLRRGAGGAGRAPRGQDHPYRRDPDHRDRGVAGLRRSDPGDGGHARPFPSCAEICQGIREGRRSHRGGHPALCRRGALAPVPRAGAHLRDEELVTSSSASLAPGWPRSPRSASRPPGCTRSNWSCCTTCRSPCSPRSSA